MMLRGDEEQSEGLTSLTGVGKETAASIDWLGRPADNRHELGGWICSLCAIGAFCLLFSAFYGIAANLVIYLVDVWDASNATAASTVTTVFGTASSCSVLGAFVSDAYIGRLWGSVLFEIFALLSFLSITLVHILTSDASDSNVSKTVLLYFIYVMALTCGSTFPSLQSLGADQLRLDHEKAQYFTIGAISVSAAQLFGTTIITYLDAKESWAWGFCLCTIVAGAAMTVSLSNASKCRQHRAGGNPLKRVLQVLVAATLNRNMETPLYPNLLHETDGEQSAIPGCRKLRHTNCVRFLDKAATTSGGAKSPWRLCTVTQVEEVKCLVLVMPVGLSSMCLTAVMAQMSTLFVEQGAAMNAKLVGGVSIGPASMQLFAISASLLTGLLNHTAGGRLRGTSLQRQGSGMLLGIVAMVVAGVVEAQRRHVTNCGGGGKAMSIMWLIPQYVLLGAANNLMTSGSMDFFYREVSDGMRTISVSISMLFQGLGNYLSSVVVLLISSLTTIGDKNGGWIPEDLNKGHVDYFYWSLAALLTFSYFLFLRFALFYTYREMDAPPPPSLDTFIPVLD